MARYVAFLRGVMPTNAKMGDLIACFESAGFTDVKTVLGSGNVVFTARTTSDASLGKRVETAMEKQLGRVFPTTVRSAEALEALLASDPFAGVKLTSTAKRVVSFLKAAPSARLSLPDARDGVRIVGVRDREVFTAYEPNPKGPVFMTLLEKTFGKEITTRTWDTVLKCRKASA